MRTARDHLSGVGDGSRPRVRCVRECDVAHDVDGSTPGRGRHLVRDAQGCSRFGVLPITGSFVRRDRAWDLDISDSSPSALTRNGSRVFELRGNGVGERSLTGIVSGGPLGGSATDPRSPRDPTTPLEMPTPSRAGPTPARATHRTRLAIDVPTKHSRTGDLR